MKRISCYILCWLVVGMGLFAQNNSGKGLTIEGSVSSSNMDGDKISLYASGMFIRGGELLGETVIKDGKYSFSVPDFTESALVNVQTRRMSYFMGVNPGDKVVLQNGKITGATANEAYRTMVSDVWGKYNNGRVPIFEKHKAILEKVEQAPNKQEAARLQGTPEYQQYLSELNAWDKEHAKFVTRQLKESPNSIWALVCLQYHSGMMTPTEEHYALLSEKVKQSKYGKSFRKILDASLLGKKAPDFTLTDANGKEHTLASLLKGNKYLLIDFWASWCKPCRKGIPVMRELVTKYQKEGVAIVNISTDKKKEDWLKALGEEKMEWTNLWDNQTTKADYNVTFIPSVFLLKADGTILFEKKYGDAISTHLKQIFGY